MGKQNNIRWEAPTRKHKPIVSVCDYDLIDGPYAGNTDTKALSLGVAQYDFDEISLKVWRRKNDKWLRMSEELPIHRNLDLTILFLKAINKDEQKNLHLHLTNGSTQDILNYYKENKAFLEPRLKELKRLLEDWL